jgi:hypothetical protein
LTCHIIPHISAPVLLTFHPFLKGKTPAALVASKHSKCSEGDVRLFTISESSKFRPVRTHSDTSKLLNQQRRRNGTEIWRRRSCQCEHLRLITHEKILLLGDVPRRNGNVTYSVNRSYSGTVLGCSAPLSPTIHSAWGCPLYQHNKFISSAQTNLNLWRILAASLSHLQCVSN